MDLDPLSRLGYSALMPHSTCCKEGGEPLREPLLLMLGGFTICFNLAIAFHELGHVLLYALTGEKLVQFVLNPFSWSWATGERAHIGVLWGGVSLGLGLSLIPLLFVRGFRLPVRIFLAHLLAACALLINGLYLAMGLLLRFGDGAALKEMGVPPGLILLLGTAYVLLSLAFWTRIQTDLGLSRDTPLPRRLAIISGGIAPYMTLIFLYNFRHNPRQLPMWAALSGAGLLSSLLLALWGQFWHRKHPPPPPVAPERMWAQAWPVLVLGLLLVSAEFFLFGTPPNPF